MHLTIAPPFIVRFQKKNDNFCTASTKDALAVTLLLLLAGCRKKAFDEYYGRPDSLEPPIYQQLEARILNTCSPPSIGQDYKNTLAAAGYWTFFAPHDSAFRVYFAANGINGMDQLDSDACRQIVTYCLVYNAYKKERIGDYQSNTGWVAANAFRRRTADRTGAYTMAWTQSGKSIKNDYLLNRNRISFCIEDRQQLINRSLIS